MKYPKIFRLLASLLFVFSSYAIAHNRVVVIPLSGDDLQPLKNIITVAKENGDFTDPTVAVASITDASATNPYLVVIAPGVYTLSSHLIMQPYVDVAGSGENVTTLQADVVLITFGLFEGVVNMALNSTLSDMTVKNTRAVIGVNHVTVISAPLLDAAGDASTSKLWRVTALYSGTGAAGGTSRGVHMEYSSIDIQHVTVILTSDGNNYGLRGYGSSPSLQAVSSTVSNGGVNRALYFTGTTDVHGNSDSRPTITDTRATASGTNSYALYINEANGKQAKPTVARSTLIGASSAVSAGAGTAAVIVQSILDGGTTGAGTYKCAADSDEEGVALNATCN